MKFSLIAFLTLSISHGLLGQPASCVHGGGIPFLLDAYLGALGACNCERSGIILTSVPGLNAGSYELIFEDNFDFDTLNTNKWELQAWGQGALQTSQNMDIATLDNLTVSNGQCHITAKKETVLKRAINWLNDDEILADGQKNLRVYNYTSSNLWSVNKFLYGKYEVRCKMPKGNGFWPAFWMFGGERWNEIDVFDGYAGIHELVTSIGHDFDGTYSPNGCNYSHKGFDLSDWHTYTCIVEYDRISVLVDDQLFREVYRIITPTRKPVLCGDNIDAGTYFQLKAFPVEPMQVIISMGLISDHGPAGSVTVDESTPFPSSFDIDYVRIWEKVPSEVHVYPNPTSGKIKISSKTMIKSVIASDINGNNITDLILPTGNSEVDLSMQSDGIYILTVELDGLYKKFKIVKIGN